MLKHTQTIRQEGLQAHLERLGIDYRQFKRDVAYQLKLNGKVVVAQLKRMNPDYPSRGKLKEWVIILFEEEETAITSTDN